MIWFFLLSGLFLGWSLGANDAANIFGTAVGTRMIRFRTAAIIASVFVTIGAVYGGAGVTDTVGALGAVNALAGSFTVALTAGLTVSWMSRTGLPVSTSQATIGAIIGWNFFTGSPTDHGTLVQIVSAWVVSPVLAGAFAVVLYLGARRWLRHSRIHLVSLDAYTRAGLVLVGAAGAYTLGANNIANVMGVFVPASPFGELWLGNSIKITGTQQLFLLGAVAISVGIFTDSYRVMSTVGSQIFKLTPIMALIVVLAHTLALFVFSSEGLQHAIRSIGLPAPPLVPVSSTQAIIGAIMGIALVKGGKGLQYGTLGRVVVGWVLTPILACGMSFVLLFVVQNVFEQVVVTRP
ncbi:MAG: inorganic phosphate transporter [Gemmatimonadetes bacterium]|nr:inorganic phosphate transporter [Gemmatimonadota bacterium]